MKRDCGENVNSEREKKPACECITRSDPIAREWLFVWFASIHLSKLSFTARSGQWPTENNLTKTTSKCICFQFSIICFTSLSNSISFAVLFVRSFGMLLVVSCVLTISQWIEFENDFFLLSLSLHFAPMHALNFHAVMCIDAYSFLFFFEYTERMLFWSVFIREIACWFVSFATFILRFYNVIVIRLGGWVSVSFRTETECLRIHAIYPYSEMSLSTI